MKTCEEWTNKVYEYLEEHEEEKRNRLYPLNRLEVSTGIEKGLKAFVNRFDENSYDSEMLTKEAYYNVFKNFLYEKYSNMVYDENYFDYIVSCVHEYEETLSLMESILETLCPTKEIDYLIGSNKIQCILEQLEEDTDYNFKLSDDYNVVTSEAGIEALLRQLESMLEERYKLLKKFRLNNYQEYNQLAKKNNWCVTLDKLTYVLLYSEHSAKLIDFFKKVNKKTSLKSLGIEVIFED